MKTPTVAAWMRAVMVSWFLAPACGLFGVQLALAAPAHDPSSIITFQLENDFIVPGSDRYYSNGVRFSYTSPTDQVPELIAALGHRLLGQGQQRYAIDLSQQIFTPRDTAATNPPLNDRPYAAILLGTFSLIQDTDDTRTALAVGLGVIGPAALGRPAQNIAHTIIGQPLSRGWGTQIPNQPVIQLTADRTWRVQTPGIGGLETDLLPAATIAAGTYRIYGQAGAQIRLGRGLTSDFGAPRVRPGLTGTDAYHATEPFAWYVFLGVDGQLVGWDETLDGLPFGSSRHVTRIPFVAELQGGAVLMAWGMRFTAAHVVRSKEFRQQRGDVFQFSSFSIAIKF